MEKHETKMYTKSDIYFWYYGYSQKLKGFN